MRQFALVLVFAGLALLGCAPLAYRFADVDSPPSKALTQAADEARSVGFKVTPHGDWIEVEGFSDAGTEEQSGDAGTGDDGGGAGRSSAAAAAEESASSSGDSDTQAEEPKPSWFSIVAVPHGAGSRLEMKLMSGDPAEMDVLLPDAPSLHVKPDGEIGWYDRFVWDVAIGAGAGIDPAAPDPMIRFDATIHAGVRALSFGDLGEEPAPRWGVSLSAGLGYTSTATATVTGNYLRPEAMITIDRQEVMQPYDGRRIPTGLRVALDLIGALLVPIDATSRSGVEAGLQLRLPRYGALFGRFGMLTATADTIGGFTASAGIAINGTALADIGLYLLGQTVAEVPEDEGEGESASR